MKAKLIKISLIILVGLSLVIPSTPLGQTESKVLASESEANQNQLKNELFFDKFNQKAVFKIFSDSVDNSWWDQFFKEQVQKKNRIWNISIPSKNLEIEIEPNGSIHYKGNKSNPSSLSTFSTLSISGNSIEDLTPS